MRNLVVCCDGTWNTRDNKDGQFPAPTNVVRIHAALDKVDAKGNPQIAYYRSGIGTLGNRVMRFFGGATGLGLENDVKSAYKWLADTYRQGDRIYFFGFSRGAYTVRSLAGMLARVGLVDLTDTTHKPALTEAEKWPLVEHGLRRYQADKTIRAEKKKELGKDDPNDPVGLTEDEALEVSVKVTSALPWEEVKAFDGRLHPTAPEVWFMGVWDTVGALGIPDDVALLKEIASDPQRHRFHDTVLGTSVRHARHAVAVDERRLDFTPTLWANLDRRPKGYSGKQVWFAGVHADVGGGYFHRGLGDATLAWMMQEASNARQGKLKFRNGAATLLNPDAQGQLHDSVSGVFAKRPTRPRAVPNIADKTLQKTVLSPEVVKRNVLPGPAEEHYWDTHDLSVGSQVTVDLAARDRWGWTGVYLRGDGVYRLKAEGEWLDGKGRKAFKGNADGIYPEYRGKAAYRMAAASEWLRRQKRQWTGNPDAELLLRFARRNECHPWFALIGVVANGRGVDPVSMKQRKHEEFLIGTAPPPFTPEGGGGYLYCYANDAWMMYENNQGMLRLTVERTG